MFFFSFLTAVAVCLFNIKLSLLKKGILFSKSKSFQLSLEDLKSGLADFGCQENIIGFGMRGGSELQLFHLVALFLE